MTAQQAIIVLSLIGFLMVAAEIFVPGMVLGILGGFCLLGAVIVGYSEFGPLTGTFIFAGIAALSLVGFVAWMFFFPRTFIGKRITLSGQLATGDSVSRRSSVEPGTKGKALTPLRPSGTAIISDRKFDVVAENDFIPAGEEVTVVRFDGMQVVVRRATGLA
jgi:membrane-bound ClpP family serine protease